MKNKEYKVTWEIDVQATNPVAAAKEALDCIVHGSAKCFDVKNLKTKKSVFVDLEVEE